MLLLLLMVGIAAWLVGWHWFNLSGTMTVMLLAATAAAVALEVIAHRDDPRNNLR